MIAVPVEDRERLLALLPKADGLLGVSFIDADMLEIDGQAAGASSLIAHGFNHIDLDAATEMGIPVSNLFFCHREVANHTLMFLLAATRKLIMLHNHLKEGRGGAISSRRWRRSTARRSGIIGFGHIGQEVAKRARALEMKIVAFDPVVKPEQAAALGVELTDLDDLLRRSDYVYAARPVERATTRKP